MRETRYLKGIIAAALLALSLPLAVQAQTPTVTFSRFNDAAAGRCYDPATTAPDLANPNRLIIGMQPCTASAPNGSAQLMDSFSFHVQAPAGYFISTITFTQTMQTSGSRGGMGFAAAQWVVDDNALPMAGGTGSVDLSLERKTIVPVSITTFLAAFGIQVVSGSATAANPVVSVSLLPLQ